MPNSSKTEPYQIVQRAADRHIARFVDPFVASVESLRRRVTLDMAEAAVIKGELTWELAQAIDGLVVAKAAEPADLAAKVYSQIMVASVTDMADYVEAKWGTPGAQLVGRFNVTSPQVLRAAQELTANLIRGVGLETKMAVRRIIFNSIRDGVAPRDAAKLIKQTLGLSTRQALAVDRLRAGLVGDGVSVSRVDRQVKTYSERLLKDRALNVARTETMLAANRGQQLLWSEAQNAGIVGQDFRQRWLVTPDDRLCSRCAPMSGKSVQLGYLFRETERGVLPSKRTPVAGASVQSPPLHPRCRCTLVAVDDLEHKPATPHTPPPVVAPPRRLGPEQYDALAPAKKYRKGLREETEKALRATPDGEVLADVINDFQHAEAVKGLRAGITKELATPGSGGERSRVLLDAMRGAEDTEDVLWRGMRVKTSQRGLLEQYAEGETFDMNLSSFSTSAGVAQVFAEGAGNANGTRVIIGVVGRKRGALPIQNLAKNSSVFSEKELLMGGKFQVIGSEKQGNMIVISLRQLEGL